jgi:hypothetical protein
MRRAALLVLIFILFCAPQAWAQFLVQETLITRVDETGNNIVSEQRVEHPSSPHTVWYFKLDVTAISANALNLYIEYYDLADNEWDNWMTGCSGVAAPGGECVIVVMDIDNGALDHETLVSEASNDIDVVDLVPMPAIWRVKVYRTGASTSSYTVTHWRY